jgi:hypothetical protein
MRKATAEAPRAPRQTPRQDIVNLGKRIIFHSIFFLGVCLGDLGASAVAFNSVVK